MWNSLQILVWILLSIPEPSTSSNYFAWKWCYCDLVNTDTLGRMYWAHIKTTAVVFKQRYPSIQVFNIWLTCLRILPATNTLKQIENCLLYGVPSLPVSLMAASWIPLVKLLGAILSPLRSMRILPLTLEVQTHQNVHGRHRGQGITEITG